MLETIVSWLLGVVGEALNGLMTYLYSLLELSLTKLLSYFPFLATAYQVLQACAIGLILAIAGWNLIKFFGGKMSNVRDTPLQILVRSALATALVFSGGYILSFIIDLAAQPYEVFRTLDPVVSNLTNPSISLVPGAADFIAMGFGAGTAMFIALIFVILIAWNLIKLFVEIVERYLLVGVLAYTSPVFYPFLCSSSMSEVFTKWVGMFIGQCAIMSVSVIFTSLICTIFSSQPGDSDSMLKLIFGLAMCKVAQRADSYMQQLGIGVATTGQNLFNDLISLGLLAGRSFRGGFGGGGSQESGGNSRASVLGSKAAGFGGIVGFAANSYKAHKEGAVGADIFKQGAKAAVKNDIPFHKTMDRYRAAQQARRDDVAKASVANETLFNDRAKYWEKQRKAASSTGGAVSTQSYADLAKSAGMTTQQYWRTQAKMNGSGSVRAAPTGDGEDGPSGEFVLNGAAQAAGLQVSDVHFRGQDTDNDDSLQSTRMLTGPDQVVASHIRDNFNTPNEGITYGDNGEIDTDATQDYQATMENTLKYGAPIVAEDVLFGTDQKLENNDALSGAAIESTFGQNIMPESVNGLHDIKAESAPVIRDAEGQIISGGGRTVTATYEAPQYDADGKVRQTVVDGQSKPVIEKRQFQIVDEVAYKQMEPETQRQMQMYQSKSGGTYYVRRAAVSQVQYETQEQGQAQSPEKDSLRDIGRRMRGVPKSRKKKPGE